MDVTLPPVVFSNIPRLEELCHVVVSIDPTENHDSSVKSDFQWQLLKTRMLLFSDFNIIASPMGRQMRFINVVCKHVYYESACFPLLLVKNRLKLEIAGKLDKGIYEECLRYTIISKIAPIWNRVENFFIKGKYFLLQRGQLSALELNIVTSDDKLYLHIYPLRLWLREADILDFDLPVQVLERSVSVTFFKDISHEPQWIHVLPSFKRGRILYVTNRIPENCTFTDYQQIRRHWKNTYGYRLPEEGSSMIYVGVNFFGPLNFTYPLCCVRRGMHCNVGDPKLLIDFTDAFNANVSVICGSLLKLEQLDVPVIPHFMSELSCKWDEKNLLNMEKHVLENFISTSTPVDSMNCTQISLCPQSQSDAENSNSVDLLNPTETSDDEWFIKCSNFIEGLAQMEPKHNKFRTHAKPVFMKRPKLFMKNTLKRSELLKEAPEDDDYVEPNNNESTNQNREGFKIVPIFQNNANSIQKCNVSAESNNLETTISLPANNFYSNKAVENAEVKEAYKPIFSAPAKTQNLNIRKSIKGPKLPNVINEYRNNVVVKSNSKSTDELKILNQSHTKSKSEMKNTHTLDDSEIKNLDSAGRLHKANRTSLLLFLKKNGIPCKTSDKKPVLLEKVNLFLSLSK